MRFSSQFTRGASSSAAFVATIVQAGCGGGGPTQPVAATPEMIAFTFYGEPIEFSRIAVIGSDGTGFRQLTNSSSSNDASPAWSPDRSRIAFTSNRDGDFEVYVMNADGTEAVRLTASEGNDTAPAWSPDGTQIAFTSQRDGNPEVYVMNADGSNQRRLTTDPDYDGRPRWSPDVRRIAFGWYDLTIGSAQSSAVYVMNADGSDRRKLAAPGPVAGGGEWSPDGSRLAVSLLDAGDYDLAILPLDGTPATVITSGPDSDFSPAWSPDGTRLVFRRTGLPSGRLHTANADGSNVRLLPTPAGLLFDPAWR